MYKVELENIENKLSRIKSWKVTKFLLILTGLMLVAAYFSSYNAIIIYFGILFTIEFVKYLFVEPLLGKIELLEEDIQKLKEKAHIKEEKHY